MVSCVVAAIFILLTLHHTSSYDFKSKRPSTIGQGAWSTEGAKQDLRPILDPEIALWGNPVGGVGSAAEAPRTSVPGDVPGVQCPAARYTPALTRTNITRVVETCEQRRAPGFAGKVVLITGTAGFVGFFTAAKLAARGDVVVGVDNFNDYYPVSLKHARAAKLEAEHGVYTVRGDLNDRQLFESLFEHCEFTHVVHLAAQAGVRYAVVNPMSYVDSNLAGTITLLEVIKHQPVPPAIVYASSSSVYGKNTNVPFSELHRVDRPASLYAATKKANEMFAHVYHNLNALSITGLRFFTVYGPYSRPDMAIYKFANAIMTGSDIKIFRGEGGVELSRDFTYIDDIVAGVEAAVDRVPPSIAGQAWLKVYNLGNTQPHTVTELVDMLEEALDRRGNREYVLLPALGDVLNTNANISLARQELDYTPQVPLQEGLKRFAAWYYDYYGPNGDQWRPDELQYKPLRR